MWKNIKRINSSNENVSKFVFEADSAVVESVLYKYPTYKDRTVICCSTQSGCPVGCRFCFLPDEIVDTVIGPKKIQDVKEGDLVLSYSFDNNARHIDKVNSLFSRIYNGKIIEIELEDGRVIKVTECHEVYLKNGSIKKAGELTEQDELFKF